MSGNATAQPANALELRIYDLLRPFRNECFTELTDEDNLEATEMAVKHERKAIVLARKST